MFREYLRTHFLRDTDFSGELFKKACDREYWSARKNDIFVKEAEKYLSYPWPTILATDWMAYKTSGNRISQETPHFERRCALIALVLGEINEYKGRFMPQIVNGIHAICEETFWGISAHEPFSWTQNEKDISFIRAADCDYIDLFSAETASMLAGIYYVFNKELCTFCPEILTRIEYECKRRIQVPYLMHHEWFWMGYNHDVNNWNPWIISNLVTVFLILGKDEKYNAIVKMITELQRFYDRIPDDGGCDEGPSYWTVSGATLFEFCDQLFVASGGKVNFLKDPKVKKAAEYITHIYIGKNRYLNFSDGTAVIPKPPSGIIYRMGIFYNDNALISFAGETARQRATLDEKADFSIREPRFKRDFFYCAYFNELLSLPRFEPENVYFHPDTETAAIRDGLWLLGAKGGHNNEGHNHNDVGSFILCYDSKQVLIDPGCGTYVKDTFSEKRYSVWTMQSQYHNLPTVNGTMQKEGQNHRSGSFILRNSGVECEFSKAYTENAHIKSLVRSTSLQDGFTLKDSFIFESENNTYTEYFMTAENAEIKGSDVLLGDKFVLRANVGKITVDSVSLENDVKLVGSWDKNRLFRIGFTVECGSTSDFIISLRRI